MPPKRHKPSPLQPPVRFTARSSPSQGIPTSQSRDAQSSAEAVPTSQLSKAPIDLGVNPESEAPLTVKAMYQMLAALRADIASEFKTSIQEMRSNITDIGDRTDHLETKVGELVQSHNSLIDAHDALQKEVDTMKLKMVDLEDRTRRNNIKIRGIPETIQNNELGAFVLDIFRKLLPDATDSDLIIDRIHRLPKSKMALPSQPRDALMRIHFFHVKENILRAARNAEGSDPLGSLQLFPDLSADTLTKRRQFRSITTALRAKDIPYRWGFPVKILVRHSGSLHVIASVEEGLSLLATWNVPVQIPATPHPSRVTADWNQVGET